MNGCLFSIHIFKGSFIIGILGLILSVFIAGWCLFFHSFVFLSIGGLSFCCYLSLIIGNHLEEGVFFWPFFLLMPLVILTELAFAFMTLLVHGAAMFLDPREMESDNDVKTMMQLYPAYFFEISQIALVFGCIILVSAFLQMYFYSVIVRAYGYLLKVRKYPPPLSIGWSHRV